MGPVPKSQCSAEGTMAMGIWRSPTPMERSISPSFLNGFESRRLILGLVMTQKAFVSWKGNRGSSSIVCSTRCVRFSTMESQ